MDLILWRHAEAEEPYEGKIDIERRLTTKGRLQARKMAKWLRPRLPKDTRILVSPAYRAQETAAFISLTFLTNASVSIDETVEDALLAAGWPHQGGTCLLVGHQPQLGLIASRLMDCSNESWTIKKGAVWWFSLRQREGEPDRTILKTCLLPRDA